MVVRVSVVATVLALGSGTWAQSSGGSGSPTPPAQPTPPKERLTPPPAVPSPVRGSTAPPAPPGRSSTAEAPIDAFDPSIDVKAHIARAIAEAPRYHQRVMIVWGSDTDPLASKLRGMMDTPDNARFRGLEYREVWAEIVEGPSAEANRVLAKSYGVDIKPGDPTMFTVLDDTGKLVENVSSTTLHDKRLSTARPVFGVRYVQDFLTKYQSTRIKTLEFIAQAVERAAKKNKPVLIWFGDYSERWSRRFERLLSDEQLRTALDKHVDVEWLELSRHEGAWDFLDKQFAGYKTLPLFAVFGTGTDRASPRTLATSQPAGGENIGYPSNSAELDQTIAMIRAACPGMTEEQGKELRAQLERASAAIADK